MLRSLSTGITGLKAHQEMMDVLSNDIANVNTVGYKAQRTSFKDTLFQTTVAGSAAGGGLSTTNSQQIGLGTGVGAVQNVMDQGALNNTGNPLDLAIQGEGFFRVTNTPATFASVQYTRAGNFQLDDTGTLVTSDGYYVIGQGVAAGGGPNGTQQVLQVPAGAKSVNVDQSGLVTAVDPTNTVVQVGYVTLAKFNNATGLDRISGNRWAASAASGAETQTTPGLLGAGSLVSGSLEMSNVDLSREFSDMILAERGFQANSRTITTGDEMLTTLVQMKR